MTTIQNSFKRFSTLFRITMAAALLLAGLSLAPSAQATLITGGINGDFYPDLLSGYTNGSVDVTGWEQGSDTGSFYATLINGSHMLQIDSNSYNNLEFKADLLLKYNGTTGFFIVGNESNPYLKGDIVAVGDDGTSTSGIRTYFFLLSNVTSSDSNFDGFGPMAGIKFTDFGSGNFMSDTVNVPVPEPATVVLLAAGLAGLVALRRRQG